MLITQASSMNNLNNFKDFTEAGQAILEFLSQHLPFQLWMITRTEGNDWIVLQSKDHGYEVKNGNKLTWQDSFCFQMIEAGAPRIAPSAAQIPLYKNAKINQSFTIQSYIGEPIVQKDGTLFGTLCAIDPNPQSEDIKKSADLITLLAKLLSNILQSELREQEQIRKSERLRVEASTDHLTGLLNRRAWDELVKCEEHRSKQYAHPITALIIDLNDLKLINDQQGHGAGDQIIKTAAQILKASVRNHDVVARLGGDEFGILLIETNQAGHEVVVQRILDALEKNHVSAAIGVAVRDPMYGLNQAIKQADLNMYENKKSHKQIMNSKNNRPE